MFDYIVVGAGSAGCTLAARLTEDPASQVLLVEAGPAGGRTQIATPAAFPQLLSWPLSWNDSTEPQEHLNARKLAWPRGKVLGGSGSVGAMIHLRGCRADYDAWLQLGCAGWGFDDLTPFWIDPPASETPHPNPLTEAFLKACGQWGIARYETFEGPAKPGAGLFPVARVNGARWDAASALLRPALKRGNLTVWTGVHALRVSIGQGKATGIEYLLRGQAQQAQAAKEVILCAGAVGSPQLLLASGIGLPDQLERLGIPVIAALPEVGENLQDHPAVALRWRCPQPVSLAGTATPMNKLRYLLRRQGPLASNLLEAGAYLKSQKGTEACDLEILFAPLYSLERGVAPPAEHGYTLLATLLTPKSRGRVRLASSDPLAPPLIDPGFLTGPADRELLAKAADRAREIGGSPAFANFRGAAYSISSDELEELVVGLHDAAGTCRMGGDPASVVDPDLRVRGVSGLRVVDASVIPVLPRAHLNATVMAIAHKASRLISGRSS